MSIVIQRACRLGHGGAIKNPTAANDLYDKHKYSNIYCTIYLQPFGNWQMYVSLYKRLQFFFF